MADSGDQASGYANTWLERMIDIQKDDLAEKKRAVMTVTHTNCVECGDSIAAARRQAVPGVRLCSWCQSELENVESS